MRPWLIFLLGGAASAVATLIIFAAIEQRDVNLKKGTVEQPVSTTTEPYDPEKVAKREVENRRRYREELNNAFLRSGINIHVSLESSAKIVDDGLVLLGPLSRPSVYNIATAMGNLNKPRLLGFRSVEFFSTIGEGNWKFNIGYLPTTCDRDLCFEMF